MENNYLEDVLIELQNIYEELKSRKDKKMIKKMIAQADDRMVSRFHRGDFSPTLNIIASYKASNKSLLEDYIENKEKRQMNIFEIKEEKQNDN